MDVRLLRRRVEMLDAVSTGLHPSVVVGQWAGKYGVSERCLWSDWQRRGKWVPLVLGLERFAGFADVVEQTMNAVERAAWAVSFIASYDSARVGALRTVLEALKGSSKAIIVYPSNQIVWNTLNFNVNLRK